MIFCEDDHDDDDLFCESIFVKDDARRFVSAINRKFKEKEWLTVDGSVILNMAFSHDALQCAAALLNGETPIKLDLNIPDEKGRYVLHCAAEGADAQLIEFLLSHGARTDIRGHGEDFRYDEMLPLEIVLDKICSYEELKSWNQGPYEPTSMSFSKQQKQQSVFMLAAILCLPSMEYILSKLRVLAWSTKETEELFLQFVRRGELVKFAALLAAAHKKLISKDLLSDADKNTSMQMQQLIDVFERAGDAIDEYRYQWKHDDEIERTINFVAKLLEQSGFVFEPEDIDLTIYQWACVMSDDCKLPSDEEDDDEGLFHKISDILRRDDTQRFVSAINHEFKENGRLTIDGCVDWHESEILERACLTGAVGCAAALLNGETPIKLDLNIPVEKGRYVLHCAAEGDDAKVIEFLLSRGARTDIRGHGYGFCPYEMLPLEISLEKICSCEELKSWNQDPYVYEPRSMSFSKQQKQQSVFMLVAILCLPRMENFLSRLRVLAWSTKETEELFLQFVRRGELIKFAALLVAAHKKLISKDLLTDADKNTSMQMQQLVDVFERAGDAIDEYHKQEKDGVAIEQTIDFVAKLLEQSGFVFEPEDIDLTNYRWARSAMTKEWRFGRSAATSSWKKLKHPKELPFFLKPVGSFDYTRACLPWLPEKPSDKKMKMGTIDDAEATSSSEVHSNWTWPSGQLQLPRMGSYNQPEAMLSSKVHDNWTRPSSQLQFRGMASYNLSSKVHNNWTRPSSQLQLHIMGSYNRPLSNSSNALTISSTKSWPWVPSLFSFLKGFAKRI